ncbi:MAG: hypothetical protein II114_07710 [Treponema sp.]|nr:hypothetical protein [Treponema sp.]
MDNTSKMNNELDQYGVWVKTPPHDAQIVPSENTPEQNSVSTGNDDTGFEISEDDSGGNIPDSGGGVDSPDLSIPEDFFSDDLKLPPDPQTESASDVSESVQDSDDDGSFKIEVEEPQKSDDTAAEEIPPKEESPSAEVSVDSGAGQDVAADFDFEALADEINASDSEPPATSAPASHPAAETQSSSPDIEDGEVSLDAFLDSPGEDGEISVESFLSDGDASGDTNMQPDGEVSLDAFLDASDFGVGTEKQENVIAEFDDPLDIDLTFEEPEVEYDGDGDVDFSDLDAFLDESTSGSESSAPAPSSAPSDSDDILDNFDAMFDSIEDSAPKTESSDAAKAAPASFGESESVDLSEFGLGDEDTGNIKIGGEEKKPKVPDVQNYELVIDENAMDSSDMGNESTEDTVAIELDTSSTGPESLKQDEANPYSAPDNDFDVDSLLDSIVDETSSSPAPASKPAEMERTVSDETKAEETVPDASVSNEEKPVETEPAENESEEIKAEESMPVETESEEPKIDETVPFESGDAGSDESNTIETNEPSESTETKAEESVPVESEADEPITVDNESEETKTDESVPFETESTESEEIKAEETETAEAPSDDVRIDDVNIDETDADFQEIEGIVSESSQSADTDDMAKNEFSADLENEPELTAETEIQSEKTEGSMADIENAAEENEVSAPVFANSGEEALPETESTGAVEDTVALDDFMGSEGFSDPSICEGNRSYSPEELEQQRKESEAPEDEGDLDAGAQDAVIESLVVDPSEGGVSNDVMDDDDVIPSPFYSPLVENEGEASDNFKENGSADSSGDFDDPDESEGEGGMFNLDVDAMVPADMSGLDYDENTGIRPAENSNETVAENENKGDNIESIDEGSQPENTILAETPACGDAAADGETEEETKDTIPDAGEEQMDTNTQDQISENTRLIRQIAQELSSIREEINELKSEFAEFKNGTAPVPEPAPVDSEKESGFFSDMDDDDTIALSGDELSNILSTAEFTPAENEAEESLLGSVEGAAAVPNEDFDNNLSVDFNEENFEEPNLDSVELENEIESNEEETLPDEIEVPKVEDDAAVDSEKSVEPDFEPAEPEAQESGSVSEPALSDEASEDSYTEPEVSAEDMETEAETETTSEETFEEPAAEASVNEESEQDSEPVISNVEESSGSSESESLDAQEDNSISQDDYNYLSEDASNGEEEDEKLEPGISEEPVNTVFKKWDSADPEAQEDAGLDAAVEEDFQEPVEAESGESAQEESPAAEEETVVPPAEVGDQAEEETVSEQIQPSSGVSSIPEEMKQEIRSVLAYMDQLLESLPEDKIAEFAQSEQFSTYKKLFNELGLS